MIIDLRSIRHETRSFHFIIEPGDRLFDEKNGRILGIDGPLTCRVDIARAGIRYILDGHISNAVLNLECDRCLETFRRDLRLDFRVFLASSVSDPDEKELELLGDDLSVRFIEGNEVDLTDIVKEQIYLSLPMKSLCRKDCAGLCSVCGNDLNVKKCNCRSREGHPGFSKLKTLKLNGEH